MKKRILSLSLLVASSAAAEIYRGTGASGETVFSDRQMENSQPIEFKGTSVYSPPKYRATLGEQPEKPKPFAYKKLEIISPANDATLFYSEGPVVVDVALEPPLREKDKLQLHLNGSPVGEPMSVTSFSMQLEDRGSHRLQVIAQDSNGKTVGQSEAVTFYFRKHSVLFKKP